jgi:exopolysaccharide biosynthesis polyprenyl glycosylphosphotransferase
MLKQQARLVAAGLRLIDLAVLAAAFPIAYVIRDRLLGERFTYLYPISRYWPILATTLLLWIAAAWLTQLYGAYRTRTLGVEVGRMARTMLLVVLVVAAGGFIGKQHDISRLFVGIYFCLAFLLLAANRAALRFAARTARRRGYNTRTFAVVGSGKLAEGVVDALLSHPEWGLVFAGYVVEEGKEAPGGRILGRLGELGSLLERHALDEVIFAVPRERLEDIEQALLLCEEQGVGVKLCLHFFPRRIARLTLEELEGVPMLSFGSVPDDSVALFFKRAFDIAVSALALALGSPLFAAISLAIKIDSRGPVFFRQERAGRYGRTFTLYKFRSMRDGAEEDLRHIEHYNEMDGPVFKMRSDPRVTRVGRLLRKLSLDELPQFWNVLRGEMSVVGPRPPIPAEVKAYERWQRRRLSVKPGITCTWQVSGRNEVDFQRWMELDLRYIDTWSLWGDLKIFLKTIPAVLLGRGAR